MHRKRLINTKITDIEQTNLNNCEPLKIYLMYWKQINAKQHIITA